MQLHPYIINLIAEDKIAQMYAQAESDRLARSAARERRAAKRHASHDRRLGHRVPAHAAAAHSSGWSSPLRAGHAPRRDDSELVSVGRTGSDDRI